MRQFYVEVLVDAYRGSMRRGHLRGPALAGLPEQMQAEGLQDIISFLVTHFDDRRIINPDVRDMLLQSIGELLQVRVRRCIPRIPGCACVHTACAAAADADASHSSAKRQQGGTQALVGLTQLAVVGVLPGECGGL